MIRKLQDGKGKLTLRADLPYSNAKTIETEALEDCPNNHAIADPKTTCTRA